VNAPQTFYTIGHSTRSLAAFASLLDAVAVVSLADVRTVPRSRTNPQFNRDTLAAELEGRGIAYRHIAALGGLRGRQSGVPAATNGYWENESFHHYADYAMSAAFREGLVDLHVFADGGACAVMCAEAVWWRCHRRIIADYLLRDGAVVYHVLSADRIEPARPTESAKPGPEGSLVYPSSESEPPAQR
jgi:uncharacterized protein (DUF488 family)